jgi:ATP-dependent Clp protease ATP-binding subunit ClpA
MFERFTRPARTAVETATAYAQQSGAGETRPEHLFAAVLADGGCLAVRVLADAGAPPDELRAEVDRLRATYVDGLDAEDAEALATLGIDLDEVARRIDRDLGGLVPRRRRPRFARESKKALELALREALALHHDYIGTEHLLLGLVRAGDRVVLDALAAFDVEPGTLRDAVADAVREAS